MEFLIQVAFNLFRISDQPMTFFNSHFFGELQELPDGKLYFFRFHSMPSMLVMITEPAGCSQNQIELLV